MGNDSVMSSIVTMAPPSLVFLESSGFTFILKCTPGLFAASDVNVNEVFSKTLIDYQIDISNEWLDLYTDFLITDYGGIDSDYVFTGLYSHNGPKDMPLAYSTVQDLFSRLSKKVGKKTTAHMFRHAHATNMLRAGIPIEMVAKRLGHKSIETTNAIYAHLTSEDIKNALKRNTARNEYLQKLYSFSEGSIA